MPCDRLRVGQGHVRKSLKQFGKHDLPHCAARHMGARAEMGAIAKSLMRFLLAIDVKDLWIVVDLFVPVRTGLDGHHGVALRDQMTSDFCVFCDQARRGRNWSDPADTFLKGAHPIVLDFDLFQLVRVAEQAKDNCIQGIAGFIDARANGDLDVGLDLRAFNRAFRVEHHR